MAVSDLKMQKKKAKQIPTEENISQTGHIVYVSNKDWERQQKKLREEKKQLP